MSRNKKSRKPGVGSSGTPKETTKTVTTPAAKRPKKFKGKEAGNRQKEAAQTTNKSQQQTNKDPRLGSKKPIVLGKASSAKQPIAKKKKADSAVAAIRTAEPTIDNTLLEELEAIEQDERLLSILNKQEDELELSESEVDYFNEKMERHQVITDELGLTDEEDSDKNSDEETTVTKSLSEDDLWDKFDNADLSKFE